MADEALTEQHETCVQSFLRFCKFKREQHIREVDMAFDDAKEYQVADGNVYNKQDVDGMLDLINAEIKNTVEKEFANSMHMSALLVRLLLGQAERAGMMLDVETHALENEYLLGKIQDSEKAAMSKPASAFAKKASQLQSLGPQGGGTDVKIVMERDSLRQEVTALKDRVKMFERMQNQQTAMMQEKTKISDELAAAREEIKELKAGSDVNARMQAEKEQLERDLAGALAAVAPLEAKISSLESAASLRAMAEGSQEEQVSKMRADMDKNVKRLEKEKKRLEEEVRVKSLEASNASQEMAGSLSQSKQVQQMKHMMQKKSKEVTELRKRLAKYEPEDIPDGDI